MDALNGGPEDHPARARRPPVDAETDSNSLEARCEYLERHAINMEREVRRLRRERDRLRRTSQAPTPAAPDGVDWRARYEEVVNSLSWRIVWWLGTPIRRIASRRPPRHG
jgi:hypothetical protein